MANTNQWSLVRTAAPTPEPVTAEQMRKQSRISISDDDDALNAYISAARQFAEIYQSRSLLTQTWRLKLDWFPSWSIKLPMSPVQSISSITYLDVSGNTQTLTATTDYISNLDASPAVITPAYSKIWPVSRSQIAGVTITYVAGYTDAGQIPQTTLQAIKLLAAHYYMHREETEEAKLNNIPIGVSDLLACDRVLDFSGVLGSSNNMPGAVTAWGGTNWLN